MSPGVAKASGRARHPIAGVFDCNSGFQLFSFKSHGGRDWRQPQLYKDQLQFCMTAAPRARATTAPHPSCGLPSSGWESLPASAWI